MVRDVDARVIAPQGALTMAHVGPLFRQVEEALQNAPVQLDFAAIDRMDSAGLALVLGLLRKARSGAKISLTNIPSDMISFAEIYGLNSDLVELLAAPSA